MNNFFKLMQNFLAGLLKVPKGLETKIHAYSLGGVTTEKCILFQVNLPHCIDKGNKFLNTSDAHGRKYATSYRTAIKEITNGIAFAIAWIIELVMIRMDWNILSDTSKSTYRG